MDLTISLLFVLAGLLLLAAGGELLVRGAITASRALRVSPAIIGLTIVAMATSLPELAVSLLAALRGNPDLAVGNVVGSNIFNIAAIVGISAILFPPLYFRSKILRFDVLVMVGAAVLAFLFANITLAPGRDAPTATIDRLEGVIFVLLLVVFLIFRIKGTKSGGYRDDVDDGVVEAGLKPHGTLTRGLIGSIALIVAGALILTGGAKLLVDGAVKLAEMVGISERVIAITLVSAGTGLPELTTAVVAGIRKHPSIAVGNIIGSNIFNVFAILGTAAVIRPVPVSHEILSGDMWWMLGFSAVAVFPTISRRRRLSRAEGGLILAAYVFYVILLF